MSTVFKQTGNFHVNHCFQPVTVLTLPVSCHKIYLKYGIKKSAVSVTLLLIGMRQNPFREYLAEGDITWLKEL